MQQVIDRCRDRGLRCTPLMKLTIALFVDAGRPQTTTEIVGSENVAECFDRASVYRLITRLEQNGIIRRLRLPERVSSYVLRHRYQHYDYIICTVCGAIEKLGMDCPVAPMERAIASASGFQNLEHELKFFGICPECPA